MISLFLLSAFGADQGGDTPSGGTLNLDITVNFAGFTNCSVQGANGSTAFVGNALSAAANFPAYGHVGTIGQLEGADRSPNWGVGSDVELRCQVVDGAPVVDVDLSLSWPNAIAADGFGQLAAAGQATVWALTGFPADGSPHPMTIGIELTPTDGSGTAGQLNFLFVTP